ncbi:hypothetical protein KCV01_g15601, partial [Aureobasidium melanogenum]
MSLKSSALLILAACLSLPSLAEAKAKATTTETIVFMRHGEKPSGGYGQLTCQGLNRSLALPDVLITRYGQPQAIYAPDPGATQVSDPAGTFDYVRPLATIEPTAIRLGMPVNTPYGFTDTSDMRDTLLGDDLRSGTVFVAWEHSQLVKLVKKLVKETGGDDSTVPKWSDGDFDSLYVLTIVRDGKNASASLHIDSEGLNGLSANCPQ